MHCVDLQVSLDLMSRVAFLLQTTAGAIIKNKTKLSDTYLASSVIQARLSSSALNPSGSGCRVARVFSTTLPVLHPKPANTASTREGCEPQADRGCAPHE
jgi:hypothetical protein